MCVCVSVCVRVCVCVCVCVHYMIGRKTQLTVILLLEIYFSLPLQIAITKWTGKYVKLAIEVDGDPKAPFSIATTLRCRGGRYSFPWISLLYP